MKERNRVVVFERAVCMHIDKDASIIEDFF